MNIFKILIISILLLLVSVKMSAQNILIEAGYRHSISKYALSEKIDFLGTSCNDGMKFNYDRRNDFIISIPLQILPNLYCGINTGYTTSDLHYYNLTQELIGLDDGYYNGTIESIMTINSNYICVGLMAEYSFGNTPFSLGLEVNYLFGINTDYESFERLIKPENKGVFKETGTRIRNEQAAKDADVSSYIIPTNLTLAYNIAINKQKTLYLSPHLLCSLQYMHTSGSANTYNQSLLELTYGFGLLMRYNINLK